MTALEKQAELLLIIDLIRQSQAAQYLQTVDKESKPTLKEPWDEIKADSRVDVFTRLACAVAARDSIPALIAEINAMLPEGDEVTRK